MNGIGSISKLWKKTSKYRCILLMSCVALVSLRVPLQNYISLGRYQHLGIAIFLFGMGYVIQLIWSWKTFSRWARISNAATGAFFCSVGMVFYSNSWLDTRIAVQTPEREVCRYALVVAYVFFGFVIAAIWLKWIHEDTKTAAKNDSVGRHI